MPSEIASVLQYLSRSDVESAKKAVDELASKVEGERDRGRLMAIGGIISAMTRAKEGSVQTWDMEKISRAAGMISNTQMADEFDRGYAETLLEYARLKRE